MIFNHYDQITEHIYLGDQQSLLDVDLLSKVDVVLSCTDFADFSLLEFFHINHVLRVMYDNVDYDISKDLDFCYKIIDDAIKRNEKILVHCIAGVSRSASVVIYYLMKKTGKKYDEVYSYVKSKRNMIKPNDGFVKILSGD